MDLTNSAKLTGSDNFRCTGLYEEIGDYKSSQNAVYCPFTVGNEYVNLPGEASHAQDKQSENPLYNSTGSLVSEQ